jgi:hypothetical protein
MRSGARSGAVAEFKTVGANVIDPMDGHDSHSVVFDTGVAAAEGVLEVRIASPITAPAAVTPTATSQRSLAVTDLLTGVGIVFRVFVVFFISLPRKGWSRFKGATSDAGWTVPVAQPLRLP